MSLNNVNGNNRALDILGAQGFTPETEEVQEQAPVEEQAQIQEQAEIEESELQETEFEEEEAIAINGSAEPVINTAAITNGKSVAILKNPQYQNPMMQMMQKLMQMMMQLLQMMMGMQQNTPPEEPKPTVSDAPYKMVEHYSIPDLD